MEKKKVLLVNKQFITYFMKVRRVKKKWEKRGASVGHVWKVSVALDGTSTLGNGVQRVLEARDALGY